MPNDDIQSFLYSIKTPEFVVIDKIRSYRLEKNIPVCFTIDAGPNIHLLYPKKHEQLVRSWIESELAIGLVGKKWIHDEVGPGPVNLGPLSDRSSRDETKKRKKFYSKIILFGEYSVIQTLWRF